LRKIQIEAPAKINLTIDVLFKRPDGYHEVEMIMQTIGLKDVVDIELLSEKSIKVTSDCESIPNDETNLVWQAADMMINEYRLDAGLKIHIHKRIPVAAGLAGGSADAAAVIRGINELFDLKGAEELLKRLGKNLGADVPFCIQGGTALARGIGDELKALDSIPDAVVLLIKPPIFISTKEVYSRLNLKNMTQRPDTKTMLINIQRKDLKSICDGLCNVLETVSFDIHPQLRQIKQKLVQFGALGSLMSGSGPTIYGIFEGKDDAQKAAEKMVKNDYFFCLTQVD
jgi:4-diphosphocytidyl-2-C-methyl-D-erythritol kinase